MVERLSRNKTKNKGILLQTQQYEYFVKSMREETKPLKKSKGK